MPRARRDDRPGPRDPSQASRQHPRSFLTRAEVKALLSSPDRATQLGRRDHVLLLVAVETGLRVSELTGLNRADVQLGTGANLRCEGKGRKERRTPLTRTTARVLGAWLTERRGEPTDPLFPNRNQGRLSTDAVSDLLAFSWLMRWRRLVRDYERLPETHEAMIHIAMIGLMLNRLAPPPGPKPWTTKKHRK